MKKCASCTKDLPEAALHCVFCGAKQPPAPAVQPGLAKTAFGYSNAEMMDQLKGSASQPPSPYQPQPRPHPASQPPPNYGAPPQNYGGGLAPTAPANAATVFVQGGPPMAPPHQQPNPAYQATQMAPMGGMGSGPQMGNPQMGNPQMGGPQMRGPQMGGMGVHSPHQLTPQALPQVSQPPYLASQTAHRAGRPIEPWKDALPLMMIIWGVATLVAFATPTTIDPLGFNWDAIIHGEGKAKIPFLLVASVGLLGVVIGAIPMIAMPRGILAALLGLAGVAVPIVLAGDLPPWTVMVGVAGLLTLVPGLLLRNEYTESLLARVLVTLGVLALLVPELVPQGGEIPLVGLIKGVINGHVQGHGVMDIVLIVLAVVSLLVWMPGPATGGAKVFAWLFILTPLVGHLLGIFVDGNIVDAVKASPFAALASWVPESTYFVFVGYGLATVLGKQLE